MFLCCIEGEGKIENTHIKAGETLFIPANFGEIKIKGKMDIGILSYTE